MEAQYRSFIVAAVTYEQDLRSAKQELQQPTIASLGAVMKKMPAWMESLRPITSRHMQDAWWQACEVVLKQVEKSNSADPKERSTLKDTIAQAKTLMGVPSELSAQVQSFHDQLDQIMRKDQIEKVRSELAPYLSSDTFDETDPDTAWETFSEAFDAVAAVDQLRVIDSASRLVASRLRWVTPDFGCGEVLPLEVKWGSGEVCVCIQHQHEDLKSFRASCTDPASNVAQAASRSLSDASYELSFFDSTHDHKCRQQ